MTTLLEPGADATVAGSGNPLDAARAQLRGTVELLIGHRVQHNFSRGPAKGGLAPGQRPPAAPPLPVTCLPHPRQELP